MKILTVGDFHNDPVVIEKTIREANSGKYNLFLGIGDYYSENIFRYIAKNIKIDAVYLTGNRDFDFIPPEEDSERHLFHYCKVIIQDYKIVMIGEYYPPNVLQDIKEWLGDHPREKTIFCSHEPPYMIRDFTCIKTHAGVGLFREFIIRFKPVVWLCGHIHEAFGTEKFMKTTICNVAIDESKKATVIDLSKDEPKITHLDFSEKKVPVKKEAKPKLPIKKKDKK